MHGTISRKWFTANSTIGELALDGVFECYTLEPTHREVEGQSVDEWKIADGTRFTAIAAGTYDVKLLMSARFKRLMPHLIGVPGFGDIEIHWGNFPKDTHGCTMTGSSRAADFIGNSIATFNVLYQKIADALDRGESVRFTYSGLPSAQCAPTLMMETAGK